MSHQSVKKAKGATLKSSWDGFEGKVKKGAVLMLMGSADPLPEKPKFAEDMTETSKG